MVIWFWVSSWRVVHECTPHSYVRAMASAVRTVLRSARFSGRHRDGWIRQFHVTGRTKRHEAHHNDRPEGRPPSDARPGEHRPT